MILEDAGNTSRTSVRLGHGHGSHRGLRRELNEDSFLITEDLFAVADGMGGHEAGEVASQTCVETLAEGVKHAHSELTTELLHRLMVSADAAVCRVGESKAGTTLSGMALVREGEELFWLVFNVGDSRVYLLSGGELSQLSVDHSEVQEMVDQGYLSREEARHHPRRHVITRALGTPGVSAADFWLVPVREGDRFMVCTDGLTSEVDDEEILQTLATHRAPQDAVEALIDSALQAGGRDNITVVIVDVEDVDVEEAAVGSTASGSA